MRKRTDPAPGLRVAGRIVNHPGNMDLLAAAAPQPEPPELPAGLSPADFEPHQVEIIEAWYADHLLHLADSFYAILRTMPEGVEITTRRIGINAAILAKLLALTPDLEATRWNEMHEILGCRKTDFFAQKTAILAALAARDHALLRPASRTRRHR